MFEEWTERERILLYGVVFIFIAAFAVLYMEYGMINEKDTYISDLKNANTGWANDYRGLNNSYQNISDQLLNVAADANRFKDLASEFGSELIIIKCSNSTAEAERLSGNYTVNCDMQRSLNRTVITKVITNEEQPEDTTMQS